MAGMRKPLPVAWAVFDGIDRMHVAKSYSEAESCAEDIDGEIVPLYRAPRWIPVRERLPQDDENVLVFDPKCFGTHIAWCHKDTTGEIVWASQVYYGLEPTHWMPLPEPPEAK